MEISKLRSSIGMYVSFILSYMLELSRNERNVVLTCAPNEGSNQPAHPRSLIRVFIVRMEKLCILGYPNVPSENSDQTARMRRLI